MTQNIRESRAPEALSIYMYAFSRRFYPNQCIQAGARLRAGRVPLTFSLDSCVLDMLRF